jgi:hypothetical protein
MKTFLPLGCVLVVLAATVVAQAPAPDRPSFRARTDLVLLDVTVTGGNRQPVRGLTAADFTVTVNGRPAAVAGVEEVNVAPPTAASAAERSLLPDVVTNQMGTKRVVIVFIDDFSLLVSGEVSARAIEQTAGRLSTRTSRSRRSSPSWRKAGRTTCLESFLRQMPVSVKSACRCASIGGVQMSAHDRGSGRQTRWRRRQGTLICSP